MRRKFTRGHRSRDTAGPCCMRGWKLRRRHSRQRGGDHGELPDRNGTSGNGATLSIGSKAFAEEQLMAQMTKDVLDAHGFTITYTFRPRTRRSARRSPAATSTCTGSTPGTELGDYLGLRPGRSRPHLSAAFTFVQTDDEPQRPLLGRADAVRRHQRHRHQAEPDRHVRHARSPRSARTSPRIRAPRSASSPSSSPGPTAFPGS